LVEDRFFNGGFSFKIAKILSFNDVFLCFDFLKKHNNDNGKRAKIIFFIFC